MHLNNKSKPDVVNYFVNFWNLEKNYINIKLLHDIVFGRTGWHQLGKNISTIVGLLFCSKKPLN